jgi:hypothetical protein
VKNYSKKNNFISSKLTFSPIKFWQSLALEYLLVCFLFICLVFCIYVYFSSNQNISVMRNRWIISIGKLSSERCKFEFAAISPEIAAMFSFHSPLWEEYVPLRALFHPLWTWGWAVTILPSSLLLLVDEVQNHQQFHYSQNLIIGCRLLCSITKLLGFW